jgi:hypothetical protein
MAGEEEREGFLRLLNQSHQSKRPERVLWDTYPEDLLRHREDSPDATLTVDWNIWTGTLPKRNPQRTYTTQVLAAITESSFQP